MEHRRNNGGFTLTELIVICAVIAVLAAIIIPVFSSVVEGADRKSDLSNLETLNQQIKTSNALKSKAEKEGTKIEDIARELTSAGFALGSLIPEEEATYLYVWDSKLNEIFIVDIVSDQIMQPEEMKGKGSAQDWFMLWNQEPYPNVERHAREQFAKVVTFYTKYKAEDYQTSMPDLAASMTENLNADYAVLTANPTINYVHTDGNTYTKTGVCYAVYEKNHDYGNGVKAPGIRDVSMIANVEKNSFIIMDSVSGQVGTDVYAKLNIISGTGANTDVAVMIDSTFTDKYFDDGGRLSKPGAVHDCMGMIEGVESDVRMFIMLPGPALAEGQTMSATGTTQLYSIAS